VQVLTFGESSNSPRTLPTCGLSAIWELPRLLVTSAFIGTYAISEIRSSFWTARHARSHVRKDLAAEEVPTLATFSPTIVGPAARASTR
jgi:hypothetical protein